MKDKYSFPSKKNPLMNVMMDDYKYNNKKKPAAPSYNEAVGRNINKTAIKPDLLNSLVNNDKLYRNLGGEDNLEKDVKSYWQKILDDSFIDQTEFERLTKEFTEKFERIRKLANQE